MSQDIDYLREIHFKKSSKQISPDFRNISKYKNNKQMKKKNQVKKITEKYQLIMIL